MKILVFVIIAIMLTSIFVELFKANQDHFKRLDFMRNPNNTGPVLRVYLFQTAINDSILLKEHSISLPYSEYGKTVVLYTKLPLNSAKLTLHPPYLDEKSLKSVRHQFIRDQHNKIEYSYKN